LLKKSEYEAKIHKYQTKLDELKRKHASKVSKNSEYQEKLEIQNKALIGKES
jgi:hypothetical protein